MDETMNGQPPDNRFVPIDGVNVVSKIVPTESGALIATGLSVRAVVKALQEQDQDGVVCYMATVPAGACGGDVFMGTVGVISTHEGADIVYLLSPEALPEVLEAAKVTM